MKFLANTKALAAALAIAAPTVLTRTPKPVLTAIKLDAKDKRLTLTSTNMSQALEQFVTQVDIAAEGVTLVPFEKLSQIVNSVDDETVTIEASGPSVEIRTSDGKFKLFTYDPKEFPPVGSTMSTPPLQVPARTLVELMELVEFAIAKEMSRYAINGMLIESSGERITAVATTGYSLALARASVKGPKVSMVLPAVVVKLIESLAGDGDDPISITTDSQRAVISFGDNARLYTQLIDGTFPPYDSVIPKEHNRRAKVKRESFLSAIRRAAMLTNEESKGVRLAFASDLQGALLTISSRAPEMGEASIDVRGFEYEGEPLEIGFQPALLLSGLKVATAETVTFEMTAANKAGVMRAGEWVFVVMPVSLNAEPAKPAAAAASGTAAA